MPDDAGKLRFKGTSQEAVSKTTNNTTERNYERRNQHQKRATAATLAIKTVHQS
jgi:hypothetical protein